MPVVTIRPLEGWDALSVFPELKEWLLEILPSHPPPEKVVQAHIEGRGDNAKLYVYLYTAEHVFRISAERPNDEKPDGYLGCFADTLRILPGENKIRSCGLADGEYLERVWNWIKQDMIRLELRPLASSANKGHPDRKYQALKGDDG
jgi:hypothetical protein